MDELVNPSYVRIRYIKLKLHVCLNDTLFSINSIFGKYSRYKVFSISITFSLVDFYV